MRKKQSTRLIQPVLLLFAVLGSVTLLCFLDGPYGTRISTDAAACAFVGGDAVDVTVGNSVHWAFCWASAARNARIVDCVCHFRTSYFFGLFKRLTGSIPNDLLCDNTYRINTLWFIVVALVTAFLPFAFIYGITRPSAGFIMGVPSAFSLYVPNAHISILTL